MSVYRTVYEGGEGKLTEKKSKFIATVTPVRTEEEAIVFIENMKKNFWDASHNCSAYVIGMHQEIQRFSDDGEPSQTAGKPMLDVLLKEGLRDTAVVVTRYFGGTLLGTGGLIRAYSQAVKEALLSSVIITKIPGIKLKIQADYPELGKIQYILGERGITVTDSIYTDKVELIAAVPSGQLTSLKAWVTEAANGRVDLTDGQPCHLAEIGGKIKVLEE